MRLVAFGRLLSLCGLLVAAGGASAAELCALDEMIESHKAGLARYREEDYEGARARWRPLAELGFPPAQGRMAELHARGRGGPAADLKEAGRWAIFASQAGDVEGTEAVARIKKELGDVEFQKIMVAAKGWRPALPPCLRFDYGRLESVDGHSARIGPSLVRLDPRFPDETAKEILERFRVTLGMALRMSASARLFLASIKTYRIIPGDKYDRYVGWKADARGRDLDLTVGNMLDKSPSFLSAAILQEATREAYRRIPGARLNDPYQRTFKDKRIVGSVYPDVDNQPFFDAVLQALEIAERLPPDVRRHVDIIDEIRYNPISEQMTQGGVVDPGIGYYDRRLSAEGRRVVFFRRDMKWSFPADVLLTIVHEGTHATQHRDAERLMRELPEKKARLQAIGGGVQAGGTEAGALRRAIADGEATLRLWERKSGTEAENSASVKRFECEATVQEIKAAQALGYQSTAITKSPYFKLCDDVQKMMAEWKNRALREGLKRANERPER
ncbi:MAG: hypothetical protein AAB223_06140 [Pseudomonadota bacterium]